MSEAVKETLEGNDLILSLGGKALGMSEECKIDTTAEIKRRKTKEAVSGKWSNGTIVAFSEKITASGFVLTDGDATTPTYDQLKDLMLAGVSVEASYNVREASTREGKVAGGYKGKYFITQLDITGKSGDDSKYSITLENDGPVTKDQSGLSTVVL